MLILLLADSGGITVSSGQGSVAGAATTNAVGYSRNLAIAASVTGTVAVASQGISRSRATTAAVTGISSLNAVGANFSRGSGTAAGIATTGVTGLARVFGSGSSFGLATVSAIGFVPSAGEIRPMTNLEALTSSIGEELTAFAGFRSTRLTGPGTGEAQVTAGAAAATLDGLTFTLGSGSFAALSGDIFEIQDGPYCYRRSTIASVGGPTSITLTSAIGTAPGFTAGWAIRRPGSTSLAVESAFEWPATGQVILNGYTIAYGSRTDTVLNNIAVTLPSLARARFTFPGAGGVTNGATLRVGPWLVEFRTSGSYRHDSLRVQFDVSASASEIASGFIAALTADQTAASKLQCVDNQDGSVDIWSYAAGTAFNYAVTSTGFTNAVFNSLSGGDLTVPHLVEHAATQSEVVEWSQTASVADQFQNSIFILRATGADLDVIGDNLGVPRPAALSDAEYRSIIRLLGGSRRGVFTLLSALLNELVGPGDWDAIVPGDTTVTEPATVYLSKDDNSQLQSVGKTFVEAGRLRRANSVRTWGTHWNAPAYPPSRPEEESRPFVYDTVFENEPVGDVFVAWTGTPGTFLTGDITIGADGTGNVAYNGSPTFTSNLIGCKLCIVTPGPYYGATTTLTSQPSAGVFAVGPLEGYEWPTLPRSIVLQDAQFNIIRTNGIDMFRGLPDTYSGRAILSDLITATPWTFTVESGTADAGDVTNSTLALARGVRLSPDAGDSFFYSRLIRAARESTVEFTVTVQPAVYPILSGATTGLQCDIGLEDGLAGIHVGAIGASTITWRFGFINPATGALIAGSPQSELFAENLAAPWYRIRIVKPSARREYNSGGPAPSEPVQLWVNDTFVGSLPYSTFVSTTPSSSARVMFGCRNTAGSYSWRFQRTDFNVRNPQSIQNWTAYTGVASGAGQLVDSTNNPFVVVQDTGRQVSIYGINGRNAGGGTALGRWEIATPSSTSTVTLRGVERWSGQTVGDSTPTRFVVNDGTLPFGYPHSLGHTLQILNGPNAGSYTISRVLRAGNFEDLSTLDGVSQSATVNGHPANILSEEFSNVVEVSSAFPVPDDDTAIRFRINPVFPTTSTNTVAFEIHSPIGQNVLPTTPPFLITHRRTSIPGMAANTLLRVDNARVLSGQTQPLAYRNELVSPGVYDAYPFYLWDRWGPTTRALMELCRAAGYHIDLDRLFRDATGLHVL